MPIKSYRFEEASTKEGLNTVQCSEECEYGEQNNLNFSSHNDCYIGTEPCSAFQHNRSTSQCTLGLLYYDRYMPGQGEITVFIHAENGEQEHFDLW